MAAVRVFAAEGAVPGRNIRSVSRPKRTFERSEPAVGDVLIPIVLDSADDWGTGDDRAAITKLCPKESR